MHDFFEEDLFVKTKCFIINNVEHLFDKWLNHAIYCLMCCKNAP